MLQMLTEMFHEHIIRQIEKTFSRKTYYLCTCYEESSIPFHRAYQRIIGSR